MHRGLAKTLREPPATFNQPSSGSCSPKENHRLPAALKIQHQIVLVQAYGPESLHKLLKGPTRPPPPVTFDAIAVKNNELVDIRVMRQEFLSGCGRQYSQMDRWIGFTNCTQGSCSMQHIAQRGLFDDQNFQRDSN